VPGYSAACSLFRAPLDRLWPAGRCVRGTLSGNTVEHNPALVRRLMGRAGRAVGGLGVLAAQAMAAARYAARLRQGRIRARTLVVHGSADTFVGPRDAKLLADRITGARLVTFPELGHLLFWEDPCGSPPW